ncbi:MAG: peptidoglycan DD-metalloendopeptidase family protein [Patescibacteria group bacterium]|nr:peptidoglycan DD-metalloendopeptidase family protein [Patescibacteria group bacterium]
MDKILDFSPNLGLNENTLRNQLLGRLADNLIKNLIVCHKLISKFSHNSKSFYRLKRYIKPSFCLFILLIIVSSMGAHQVRTSDVKNIFLSKETNSQDSSSVLGQGEEKKEYPDMFSIQNNSLLALSPSVAVNFKVLGAVGSEGGASHDETGIEEYVVQAGDTISSIAQHFNITTNTILWANSLTSKSIISPGKILVILPTTGAMHIVANGDTLGEVAEDYKVKKDAIVAFNGLKNDDIFIGDILIIPEGIKPAKRKIYPTYTTSLANSYFIAPVPSPWVITQGLHWYNAIDFATGKCNSPVYAAAGGEIQRTGWDSRAGRYVRILHPNGVVTFYGHLSKIIVSPGQKVSQGKTIGYIGYSGHTIPAGPGGCHLHWDVRGARNPFAR